MVPVIAPLRIQHLTVRSLLYVDKHLQLHLSVISLLFDATLRNYHCTMGVSFMSGGNTIARGQLSFSCGSTYDEKKSNSNSIVTAGAPLLGGLAR